MRILIVAMSASVHVARWLKQLTDQGWEIHLFPCAGTDLPHADMRDIVLHALTTFAPGQIDPSIRVCRPPEHLVDRDLPTRLAELIKRINPDIIHSMEFQHCSYLTMEARKRFSGKFPPWAVSNWGSDIYLFGRLPHHAKKIREVLANCDYYYCECCRDVKLAREFGFQGKVLPVFPVAGGFDIAKSIELRQPGPPSGRRLVMLKGYQTFAGRALVGIRALHLCAPDLRAGNYRAAIYSHSPDVALAAELFSQETGVPIELMPYSSHDDMLRMFGRARVYVGLSISDAISTSLLEAMVMGAFPIQSWTACADEWLIDGKTGNLVPPEDPEAVAAALRVALNSDSLVNTAAQHNESISRTRLDVRIIGPKVVDLYRQIAPNASRPRKPDRKIRRRPKGQALRQSQSRTASPVLRKLRETRVARYCRRAIRVLRKHGVRIALGKLLAKIALRTQGVANRLLYGY